MVKCSKCASKQNLGQHEEDGAVAVVACGSHPFAFVGAENGSINHIVVTEDRWIVRRFNDTGHLATDLDKPVQPLT